MTETPRSDNDHGRPHLWIRVGVVFVAATLLSLLTGQLAAAIFGSDYTRGGHVLRAAVIPAVALPMIILARARLDRRPWQGLGLTLKREAARPALAGALCWLLPAAAGAAICFAAGWTEIIDVQVWPAVGVAAALVLLVFFYEALPEELIFRGYLYRNLATRFPAWGAVAAQALLFTLWGLLNGGENSIDRSALFFTFAIVVGCFRVITGSVWTCVGFHLAFQVTAQSLGEVGGQFEVRRLSALMVLAFVALPFTLGPLLLRRLYPASILWRAAAPD